MEEENKTKHTIVQTYAEDMAKVIQDDQGGLIKKIIHGEEEHDKEKKKNPSPELSKNRFFMLISLLLILTALAVLFFFFFNKNISTVDIEKQFTPIIFNDRSAYLEVKGFDKDEIIQTILSEVDTTRVKNGGVEGIYLTYDKKVIGLREFIKLIKGNFVLGDRIFVNDNFLLGVENNETKDFFILIKVRSIADVFDSLRAWENKMFIDLQGFFRVAISPETKYLLTKNFEDGVVENKNARILYDENNKIVMMYILADDTSIIITNTKNVAHEIMLRLASSRIEK